MEKLNKLKIVSGHQPAYLPWLGYFHKILISDEFIYMDTVQYSRGWINKNIINGKNNQTILSVPLIKADKFEEINKLKIKYSAKDNWKEKDVILANHPTAGGSHLPDMTIITPVFKNGKPVFYVASRGHHADIGGI